MGILYDIYADGQPSKNLFHMKEIGGVISPTVGGDITEANGWRRVRMPRSEWVAYEKAALERLATLKKFWTAE